MARIFCLLKMFGGFCGWLLNYIYSGFHNEIYTIILCNLFIVLQTCPVLFNLSL